MRSRRGSTDLGFAVTSAAVAPDEVAAIIAVVRARPSRRSPASSRPAAPGSGRATARREAVSAVLDYVIPGFGEAMRPVGRDVDADGLALAIARPACGAARLVVCVPGSPRGALESLAAVEPLLEHALEMLAGRTADAPDGGRVPDDRARRALERSERARARPALPARRGRLPRRRRPCSRSRWRDTCGCSRAARPVTVTDRAESRVRRARPLRARAGPDVPRPRVGADATPRSSGASSS